MAKKTQKAVVDSVRGPTGAFTKFYTFSENPALRTAWDTTALSYLDTRSEFAHGLTPGYCEIGGKLIIGFKGENNLFIS